MKLTSLLVLVIMTGSCAQPKISGTIKNFRGDDQPYAQSWTGGIPGSGSGINLFLPLFDTESKNIDAVYYKGTITTVVDTTSGNPQYIVARFSTDFNQDPDRNMSLDPKKEYGNEVPKKKKKFPFKLADDEAVIKIGSNGKFTYMKIADIKTKEPKDLPSRPQ